MPLIAYKSRKFKPASEATIRLANEILAEYEAQGFDLTLRQLYYQFVSRGLIPNSDREYQNLGTLVNKARMAGRIDWDHIVDRTRNLRRQPTWKSPAAIIRGAAKGFAIDKWKPQPTRIEVWIEKDALAGVIAGVCDDLGVPYFSCRGYTSQSEMWSAAQRIGEHLAGGQSVRILHLGDHDPSGIDMTRDITDRLEHFTGYDRFDAMLTEAERSGVHLTNEAIGLAADEAWDWMLERFAVDRLALNWDQIEEYRPPPNPAKLTDSRGRSYVDEYGDESWELDALEPRVIASLISGAVEELRDDELWEESVGQEERHREGLQLASDNWPKVAEFLKTL